MDLQLKLEDGLFHYRGGCSDLIIFRSVHDNNEYKVTPEDIKDKTVIDIGAHIGSFTRLALRMGAKKVIAVEASPMNYEYLIRNTKEYKNCITINAAVGIFENKFTYLIEPEDPANTGGRSARFDYTTGDLVVMTVMFDDIFRICGECHLMKIDCEGSEFDILCGESIRQIHKIVGEYHESETRKVTELMERLEGMRFSTKYSPLGPYSYKTAEGDKKMSMLGHFEGVSRSL